MNPLETAWGKLADHTIASAGSVAGFVTALILILVARVTLPSQDRRKLRGPLVLLLAYLVLWIVREALPPPSDVDDILRILALFFLLLTIGKTAVLLTASFMARRRGQPLPRIITDIVSVLVLVAVAMIALRAGGVSLGSLLTTSAVLTAVIGLSLQETLGNLFAGLSIQMQEPFEVGDWIQFDADPNLIGQVVEVNWRATKVLTYDQVEVIVPNGVLAKVPIRNFSKPTLISRRTVVFQAPYEAAPGHVQQLLTAALRDAPGVLATPAVEVTTSNFADSGIEYQVRFFIDRFADRVPIEAGVRDRIWYALSRADIAIPFPIRDVRMRVLSESPDADAADRARSLECVHFLRVLSPEQRQRLAAKSQRRRYAPDEAVIREGEPGEELFIIVAGEVAVRLERNDKSIDVSTLGPAHYFGEMSLLTGAARTATVRALRDTELLVVGKQAFGELLAASPALADLLSDEIARRRAEFGERTGEIEIKGDTHNTSASLVAKIKAFFRV